MRNEQRSASVNPVAPTPGLMIYLLGPLRIERDGIAIHLPRRKVEALVAYLLLHPEPQTRDHLATLFWGDSSDAQARHSLRTALATVRKEVAADLLLADREQVQRNPTFPCWVDLAELLALEEELATIPVDHLLAKVALWQGELLTGIYDDWATLDRERCHTHLLTLCLQVIQHLRSQSAYPQAITVAQQVLTFDPANEQAHQQLMFCYMAAGDRGAALRQFELCKAALLAEVDAPPMAATTALYYWIKQQDSAEGALAARITNLPIPLTSFIGRAAPMTAIKRLLNPTAGKTRLLTLTGAGGSGKTRLAIQVATDLIDSFAHGVWWVALAALQEGDLIIRTIAKTVGVTEVRGQSLRQTVSNFLRNKQLLLVIDNCEHLIAPCADLVADLLSCAPQLQILTTSREPLNLAGEMLWQAPPFAMPDLAHLAAPAELLQVESIHLFVERAVAVQPNFTLTAATAPAVAAICQHLDGMPLAIELAAARVKVLTVEQIAAYLTSAIGARFALLTQGSRTALPRQQTLRATIDWSYHLLAPAEQTLFRQLAVFSGSFTLEALEQIWDFGSFQDKFWILDSRTDSGVPSIQNLKSKIQNPLDLLTQLVDKSLVIVETHGGQNRYRLLETLRAYALEQGTNPAEMTTLRQRHAEYFLALVEQAEPAWTSAAQQLWLARLEIELANLRSALAYATAGADRELALRLAAALLQFWDIRVYLTEGREWLSKALAQRGSASLQTQARALNAAGFLAHRQDDYAVARQFLAESLQFFAQIEDEAGIAEALNNLAMVDLHQGRYTEAHQRLTQSLTLFRHLQRTEGIARVLNNLGNWAWDQTQHTAARDYYAESLRLRQQLGDEVGIATAYFNLGNAARSQGDFTAAHTYYEECLILGRALGHQALIGIALKNLGLVAYCQEEYVAARRAGEEALPILLAIGDKSNAGFALANVGDAAQKLGESSQALACYRQSVQLMHEAGYIRGLFLGLEDIVGLLAELTQQPIVAVRLLSAAMHLRRQANLPLSPTRKPIYDQLLTHLHQQVDAATFDTQWAQGQTTPIAQIVAEVAQLAIS